MNNQERYKKKFGLGRDKEKVSRALEHALDIRKFEIELYWKRATYFWALIAVAFAGYFAVLGASNLDDKEYLAYLIASVGFVFTWAWFLVNRGSKFWQENWENHVDMLENEVIGPLYKTILHRPDADEYILEKYITGPAKISASKTNQWVSLFTICIWVFLMVHALPEFSFDSPVSWRHVFIGVLALGASILMCAKGKTHMGAHRHKMRSRRTKIL